MAEINNPLLPDDFNSRSPIEKKRFLESAADRVRNDQMVRRPMSDDEIDQKRFALQKVSIELSDIQKEYDEVKKNYREQINDIKESQSEVISELKQGFEEVHGTTYEIRDHENERVYVVMEDGSTVDNRRMMPDERQSTIHNNMRDVSNG